MNSPPAFPCNNVIDNKGMTLRDYFAAKAMHDVNMSNYSTASLQTRSQYIARQAYEMADAMLKARAQ